ncbi:MULTISPECIES: hypothetical protein [Halomonadaceae]
MNVFWDNQQTGAGVVNISKKRYQAFQHPIFRRLWVFPRIDILGE